MIRELSDNLAISRPEAGDCEKVLGIDGVGIIATHYKTAHFLYQLMETNGLMEYAYNPEVSHSSEENRAYKEGVQYILKFMQNCHNEVEMKKGVDKDGIKP